MSRGLRRPLAVASTPPIGLPLREGRSLASASLAASTQAGGAGRDRTGDLRLQTQALSQLSYSPELRMVGLSGFEPLTSRLSAVRSSQLSYRPVVLPREARAASWMI